MSKIKKPIREGYHTPYDYYADLAIYYLKTNIILYISIIIVTILIVGGIFYYNYDLKKKNEESTKLLEKTFDKLTLFINHYSKMDNFEETKNSLINSLKPISEKYFRTTNGKRATYYLGLIYYLDKKYDNSFKYLSKLLKYKKFYLTPFAYYGSIICLSKMNKNKEAISLANEFYEKFKKTDYGAEASYILGILYEIKGDYKEAIKYYRILEKNYSKSSLLTNSFIKNSIYFTEAIYGNKKEKKENDKSNDNKNKK